MPPSASPPATPVGPPPDEGAALPATGRAGVPEPPVRSEAVWAALDPLISGGPLQILDVGGGAGVFAVPLAQRGHQVTVVDASADALATLRRRAELAAVSDRVRGLQGDADRLTAVLGGAGDARSVTAPSGGARPDGATTGGASAGGAPASGYDLVLVHSVLEGVDDPAATLAGIATTLRPGGQLSVTAANRAGAVLARALSGHPVEARALLADQDPAPARVGGRPPRRRYSPDELLTLIRGAGLQAGPWRGVSVVADLLESTSGAEPAALRALELELAGTSPFRDIATGLHVLATRAVDAP